MASRFLLLFVLGRYLDADSVGMYGLMHAYITYAIYALGFEYYNYSTREIIIQEPDNRKSLLASQLVFFGIVYAIVLPLLSLVFIRQLLPWQYALWFYGVLIFEHLSHEVNRVLVAISEPIIATLMLFIKMGAWAIVFSVLLVLYPNFRTIEALFIFWFSGVALSTIWGSIIVFRRCWSPTRVKILWRWIGRGIQVAFPLLIASLALRGMYSLDKIFMERTVGLAALGAYTLYSSISNAVIAFIDAGLIVFYYPKIVMAASEGNKLSGIMRALFLKVLIYSISLVVGGMIVARIAIPFLGKVIYMDNYYMLAWQMAGAFLYCVGIVPQLGLYGMRKDLLILLSNFLALLVFIMSFLFLRQFLHVYAVLLSQFIGFLVMAVLKSVFYRSVKANMVEVLC